MVDRHYALFANNQHPLQLDTYDEYNRMLRVLHSDEHQSRQAETQARYEEVKAERTALLNHEEGESLSIDELQDIYIQVKAEERAKYNFELTTRTRKGEINDYLEVRRPFGAAE